VRTWTSKDEERLAKRLYRVEGAKEEQEDTGSSIVSTVNFPEGAALIKKGSS